jgi:WD40 repeat protein
MRSAIITNSGKFVLIATWDNRIVLCDLVTGKVVKELIDHTDHIQAITFSCDDKQVLTGSCNGIAILWDLTQDSNIIKPYKSFKGHRSAITGVAICNDGNFAITGALDGSIRYWEVASGKAIKHWSINIKHISFSPDGRYALIHDIHNKLILWDLKSDRILKECLLSEGEINTVAFHSQVKILLGLSDGSLRLYGITNSYRPSIAELVLILKLWQCNAGKAVLDNAYFSTIFSNICPVMKAILMEYYKIREAL